MSDAKLDSEFFADCPYEPDAVLFDEILEIDPERSLLRVRMPTHAELPLTSMQREHPVLHPRHVSGGLIVHVSGMVGFAHAFYLLGIRRRQGWTGYGVRIKNARYRQLALVGDPLDIEARATAVRRRPDKAVVHYEFVFKQGETVVYDSEQSAMFMRVA